MQIEVVRDEDLNGIVNQANAVVHKMEVHQLTVLLVICVTNSYHFQLKEKEMLILLNARGELPELTGEGLPIEMVERIPLNENPIRNCHLECFAGGVVYPIIPHIEAIHV